MLAYLAVSFKCRIARFRLSGYSEEAYACQPSRRIPIYTASIAIRNMTMLSFAPNTRSTHLDGHPDYSALYP